MDLNVGNLQDVAAIVLRTAPNPNRQPRFQLPIQIICNLSLQIFYDAERSKSYPSTQCAAVKSQSLEIRVAEQACFPCDWIEAYNTPN